MSTARMPAPSSASRMAWLRPWPRSAPVTKATLPATRPAMGSLFSLVSGLLDEGAGVDGKRDAGDVPRRVGGEEEHRVADVDGLHPRDRQRVELLEHRPRGFSRRLRGGRVGLRPTRAAPNTARGPRVW